MAAVGHIYEEDGVTYLTAKLADFLPPHTRRFAKGRMFDELLSMAPAASSQALEMEAKRTLVSWNGESVDLARVLLCGPDEPRYSVRFTVFDEPQGPILDYCLAGAFAPTGFASNHGVRYDSIGQLIEALDCVGLPGREICRFTDKSYSVTGPQLRVLYFNVPTAPGD